MFLVHTKTLYNLKKKRLLILLQTTEEFFAEVNKNYLPMIKTVMSHPHRHSFTDSLELHHL